MHGELYWRGGRFVQRVKCLDVGYTVLSQSDYREVAHNSKNPSFYVNTVSREFDSFFSAKRRKAASKGWNSTRAWPFTLLKIPVAAFGLSSLLK
jgi:hypothetical protein